MTVFRIFLVLILLTNLGYTGVVVSNHGMGLLPIFFGEMAQLGWPGQFNVDFMSMLTLSGLWVAYRHRFRAPGILLGLGALGGVLFMSVYLLVLSSRKEVDVATLLLGESRPAP